MLKIGLNESKTLDFDIELSGIDYDKLEGHLRFLIDNVEYGLKVKVSGSTIHVDIPPLNTIVKRELKEGEVIPARLDVVGNGYYLNPWSDSFEVSSPVKMTAKIVDKAPEMSAKVKESTKPRTKKATVQQNKVIKEVPEVPVKKDIQITKESVMRVIGKYGSKNPEIQALIYNKAASAAGSADPKKIMRQVLDLFKHKR